MAEWKTYSWSEWRCFPDPQKGQYLYAPFGGGVYRLRNKATKEYVLFGKSKHVARRMSSLLPPHWVVELAQTRISANMY